MHNEPWDRSRLNFAIKRYASGLKTERRTNASHFTKVNRTEIDKCLTLPDGIEKYAANMAKAEIALLEVNSKISAGSIAQEIPKLIKAPAARA